MGPGAAPFILIFALFVIGVPVLAIVAYVRVGAVKSAAQAEAAQLIRRIYALEQRLAQIEKGLSALNAAASAVPSRGTSEAPATALQPHILVAPPVSAPAAPSVPAPLQSTRPPFTAAPAMPSATPMHTAVPNREHAPALSQPMSRGKMTSSPGDG